MAASDIINAIRAEVAEARRTGQRVISDERIAEKYEDRLRDVVSAFRLLTDTGELRYVSHPLGTPGPNHYEFD